MNPNSSASVKYRNFYLNVSRLIVSNQQDAEDCVQSAILKTLRLDPSKLFCSEYLKTAVVRQSLNTKEWNQSKHFITLDRYSPTYYMEDSLSAKDFLAKIILWADKNLVNKQKKAFMAFIRNDLDSMTVSDRKNLFAVFRKIREVFG